jgi:hypothetical protein
LPWLFTNLTTSCLTFALCVKRNSIRCLFLLKWLILNLFGHFTFDNRSISVDSTRSNSTGIASTMLPLMVLCKVILSTQYILSSALLISTNASRNTKSFKKLIASLMSCFQFLCRIEAVEMSAMHLRQLW